MFLGLIRGKNGGVERDSSRENSLASRDGLQWRKLPLRLPASTLNPIHMLDEEERLRKELDEALAQGSGPKIARFALACLSGIPFAGGVFSAASGAWSEKEQDNFNKIFSAWLKMQEDEIKEIGQTILEVFARIDQTDANVRTRLESKEYLALQEMLSRLERCRKRRQKEDDSQPFGECGREPKAVQRRYFKALCRMD
jgi:hypothetical protein